MNARGKVSHRALETSIEDDLRELVEEVSHLLPAQAPIRRFVHHNTLHHFENLPFEEAVLEGAKTFGCEPYPSDTFFARERAKGRIQNRDIDAVLKVDAERVTALDPALPYEGWTRSRLRRFRLTHFIAWPSAAEIRFQIKEGNALTQLWPGLDETTQTRFLANGQGVEQTLTSLWQSLDSSCPPLNMLNDEPNGEIEHAVHSLLIRLCGSYLDQGVSYWPMPEKSGLWQAFLSLYGQTSPACPPWLIGLAARLKEHRRLGVSSEQALGDCLQRLSLPPQDWPKALQERAMALRGWAGMVHQMETRPDLAPVEAPPVRLMDYFAILFELELQARVHYSRESRSQSRKPSSRPNYELLYEAFVMAQLAGFGPNTLDSPEKIASWLNELREFPDTDRRRLWLLAYERRYRLQILDGIKKHCELGEFRASKPPLFQAVFCIDDREESLRRHLEEVEVRVETLGMAGFFGVRMEYEAWNDTHGLPLCPANIKPEHVVKEIPIGAEPNTARALGHLHQGLRAGRNGVLSGGLLSTTAGFFAGLSLVGRTLAPGLYHRATHGLEHRISESPSTRLKIERSENDTRNASGLWEGFTIPEMTSIVLGAMTSMGIRTLAPLFLIVGHGSSSLNNPHEAAHDCGATGGGRGGPNARAFAAMANHPQVRANLAEVGLTIPSETWFVGSYHNTCDDSMEYFDLDLVPETLRDPLEAMKIAMSKACVMDAHERCRRFHNVPLGVSPEQAYNHVQARAVTLAQPRPEYGHCTNSICIVGRRERTRGLFLDRRAFLVSYDPTDDHDGSILGGVLESVGPVGAGINLEYYFSSVDCAGYGCGTKLPHNITGLLGVMDGHSSDLRTGLPCQMVELHEPMRLLCIVEAMPARLEALMARSAGVRGLVSRGWIQLVAWSPKDDQLWNYQNGTFVAHQRDSQEMAVVGHSRDYYGDHREHLPPARIQSALLGGL